MAKPQPEPGEIGARWVAADYPPTRALHEAMVEDGINLSWSQVVHRLRAFCEPLSIGAYRAEHRAEMPAGDAGKHQTTFTETDTGAVAHSVSNRIRTLDGLLEACEVDTGMWHVDRHVVNKWEVFATEGGLVELIQVKAWLSRRQEYPVEAAVDAAIARLAERAPRYKAAKPLRVSGDYLFVPNLYDAHFNKRANGYTIGEAGRDFKAAGDALIARVQALGMPIRRILLPTGHDALHADNLLGTTTKGTWVELAADQRDAIDALVDAYVHLIEQLAEVAPVDVVTVESNHDRYSTYWLGKLLSAWFRQHPRVTVDADKGPRKYYRFGRVLLGLEHGDTVKPADLALTMAVECPDGWAASEYREWLRGHIHKQQQMYRVATEERGVNVRVIPALCPPDEYHILAGYVGNHRAAEGLFYHAEHGPAGSFPVFVDELVAVDVAAPLARAA